MNGNFKSYCLLMALFLLAISLPWTGLHAVSGFESPFKSLLGWKGRPPVDFVECNADSLDVVASYGGEDDKHIIDQLYANLISCTDVLSLSLKIFQGGCVVSDGNPWSFNFRKGDTFPHLESLTLSGYDRDSRKTTSWWAQMPSNLESWRLAMDWTRLKYLDIDLPPKSFLEAFSKPDQLARLESLVLRPRLNF